MMTALSPDTLVLTRDWMASRIPPMAYVDAVDETFRRLAGADAQIPPVGHLVAPGAAIHIKSAAMEGVAAIKINANVPANPTERGLPTIQGLVALVSLRDGRVLALMDSMEVTAQRTAATTAVAARYLARPQSQVLSVVGCGVQARYHLHALAALFPLSMLRCHDVDVQRSRALAAMGEQLGWAAQVCASPAEAARGGHIVATCTPSQQALLRDEDVAPGTFVAGVGADSPDKQELHPSLMANATVVTDLTSQASAFGDLRHAIAAGAMKAGAVYGELADVVGGTLPGRMNDSDRFVFDSTRVAIADLAAAQMSYSYGLADPAAMRVRLGGGT